jgi:molybdopterin-guanine dinucleotide biosynthesis protein A
LPWPHAESKSALLDHVHSVIVPLCDEVLVVGNRMGLTKYHVVKDIAPVASSLTGLVSGLQAANNPLVLAVACDLPFLNRELLRALIASAGAEWDVVAPVIRHEPETLQTVYRKSCLPIAKEMLKAGDLRLGRLVERLRVREIPAADVRQFDPDLRSFYNINTPQDLAEARAMAESE